MYREKAKETVRKPMLSISYEMLVKDKAKEETLSTLVSEIWEILKVRKPGTGNNALIGEVRLRAESLRNKKKRRALLLSAVRAVSALMLFLSVSLLQSNFYLYLPLVVVGCFILGVSTFLERGTLKEKRALS